MALAIELSKGFYSNSKEDRFSRIITTPLGSRVLLPFFGSKIHELIDKPMTQEWKMLFSKYLLECFFDEKYEPWDDEFVPKSIKIIELDTLNSSVSVKIEFEDEDIEFNMGGF